MKRFTLLLSALILAGSLANTTVLAQDDEEVPAQPVVKTVAKPPSKAAALKQIRTLLENLGYEPQPYNNKEGVLSGFNLKFPSGSWTISFSVSMSGDRSFVWFTAPLSQVPNAQNLSGPALLKLLAANDQINPALFTYDTTNKRFYLMMPVITPEAMKPAVLRERLERFSSLIKDNEPIWKAANWTKPAPPGEDEIAKGEVRKGDE